MIPRAPQETVGTTVISDDFEAALGQDTVLVQPGYGQYFKCGLLATKWRTSSSWKRAHVAAFSFTSATAALVVDLELGGVSGTSKEWIKASGATSEHRSAMHRMQCSASSRILDVT